ncbi:MAG TPA: CocE/NonD family hydrolase [Pyrinomonadaceae bacterium]|nr:CocE/NonD family hydrolase [Pyrinomonadaceae bacterium]
MKKAITYFGLSVVTLFCFATFAPINAQNEQQLFTRTDAMIAMRDGIRLNTRIYAPTRTDEQFPLLLLRTPYGIGNSSEGGIIAPLAAARSADVAFIVMMLDRE